uniref:NADH dehydrogenase [ubiquinone] flavoprotein 3, mitochondrial n=1 Tax=Lygus hesperus TaxID=30085 RepID=A0A0A9Z8K3_LYGHE
MKPQHLSRFSNALLAIKELRTKNRPISAAKTLQAASNKFPGFSKEVIEPNCNDVGPGAMKEGSYQNPEYFCYNEYSYYELHILLRTFRIPQPSSLSKQDQHKMDERKNKSKC